MHLIIGTWYSSYNIHFRNSLHVFFFFYRTPTLILDFHSKSCWRVHTIYFVVYVSNYEARLTANLSFLNIYLTLERYYSGSYINYMPRGTFLTIRLLIHSSHWISTAWYRKYGDLYHTWTLNSFVEYLSCHSGEDKSSLAIKELISTDENKPY